MNFGMTLKALRIRQGKSQGKAAAELSRLSNIHISQSYLSRLEHHHHVPRGELLNVLAEYYNVTPIYFMDYDVEIEQLTCQITTCQDEITRLSEVRTALLVAKKAHQRDIGLTDLIKNRTNSKG